MPAEALSDIGTDDLLRLMAAGTVTLVEALGPSFYADVRLPGARCLPPDRVLSMAAAVLPDRSATIVCYGSGASGPDPAVSVARVLVRLMYTDVRVYRPGKLGWIEAGLPVER